MMRVAKMAVGPDWMVTEAGKVKGHFPTEAAARTFAARAMDGAPRSAPPSPPLSPLLDRLLDIHVHDRVDTQRSLLDRLTSEDR